MILIVNTGFITTLFGLLTIITVRLFPLSYPPPFIYTNKQLKTLPNALIYAGANFLTCPLYLNTVMANLNMRRFMRGSGGSTIMWGEEGKRSMRLETLKFGDPSSVSGSGGSVSPQLILSQVVVVDGIGRKAAGNDSRTAE